MVILRNKKTPVARLETWQRARSLLIGAMSVAVLAGCLRHSDPPPPSYVFADPAVRFPISIVHERQMMDVTIGTGKSGILDADRLEIANFLVDYRRYGTGTLIIAAPSTHQRSASEAFGVSELRQLAEDQGIDPGEIQMRSSSGSSYGRSQVTLSYYREVAESTPCGSWPSNLADDRQNVPYENLGCAQRNNLAAMIARPRDLVRLRTMTDRYGPRRDVVWDKYEAGEHTAADRNRQKAGKDK